MKQPGHYWPPLLGNREKLPAFTSSRQPQAGDWRHIIGHKQDGDLWCSVASSLNYSKEITTHNLLWGRTCFNVLNTTGSTPEKLKKIIIINTIGRNPREALDSPFLSNLVHGNILLERT